MRLSVRTVVASGLLTVAIPALAATHHPVKKASSHTASSHASASRGHASLRRTKATRSSHSRASAGHAHAMAMDSERATQIQSALIKQGYLSGEPSGNWDAASVAAMQKLQADNGWQTKIMPDSRALIKLGLGPGANAQ